MAQNLHFTSIDSSAHQINVHLPHLTPLTTSSGGDSTQAHSTADTCCSPSETSTQDHEASLSPLRSVRRKSFKNRFVEVYLGTECFVEADLNVVVAIYLQATDRLYEVVIVNKDTAEEIGRLYVFEDELALQMKRRYDALTLSRNTHAAWSAARTAHIDLTTPPLDQPPNRSLVSTDTSSSGGVRQGRRKSCDDLQDKSPQARRERERRKSLLPVFSHRPLPEKDSQCPNSHHHDEEDDFHEYHGVRSRARRKSIADLHHELLGQANEVRLSSVPAGSTTVLRELELAELLGDGGDRDPGAFTPMDVPCSWRRNLKGDGVVYPREPISDPVKYFHLMAGYLNERDDHVELVKKVEHSALLNDYSLLDTDISASSVQDIRFFTAAILTSLYVRHKARRCVSPELQFLLFDAESSAFFHTSNCIPPSVHDTFPSDVSPQTLLDMLEWNAAVLTDEKEIAVVKTLVSSAGKLEDQAQDELGHLPALRYHHKDNINPNSLRIRNQWQSAINTVVKNIGVRKELRAKWGSIIELQQQDLEREALLKQHGKEGKFRPLAVDKGWCHMDNPLRPEKIIDYRADKHNCKVHHMAKKRDDNHGKSPEKIAEQVAWEKGALARQRSQSSSSGSESLNE